MRKTSTSMSSSSSTASSSFGVPTNPPIDPKDLVQRATMYETEYPAKLLVKSASGILRNAKAYDHEGAREDAFILYSRFVDLVANKLATSNELRESKVAYKRDKSCKTGETYADFQQLLTSLAEAMDRSEALMAQLKAEYVEYKSFETARQEIRELQKRKFMERKEREEREWVERRRNIERRKSSMNSDDQDLLKKLRALSNSSLGDIETISEIRIPSYPTLNDHVIMDEDTLKHSASFQSKPPSFPLVPVATSQIRKDREPSFSSQNKHNQAMPSKKPNLQSQTNHKTVNSTEGGAPLRTVFLPADLPEKFQAIAEPNTVRELETCGILVGKLIRNAFFITHLLIPEQDSTKETCSTKSEEKMFEYIENEDPDLFILGWIHTHPTQSCFLSSVDLHTQNSYQIMLNEAIAIVCAPDPKHPKQLGVFRLTDPPGVPTITNCNEPGFHPHEEPDLYVDCNRISNKDVTSGHVVIRSDLPLHIEDLR